MATIVAFPLHRGHAPEAPIEQHINAHCGQTATLLPSFRHWIFGHLAAATDRGPSGQRWRRLHWEQAWNRLAAEYEPDRAAMLMRGVEALTAALVRGARRQLALMPPCSAAASADESAILGLIGAACDAVQGVDCPNAHLQARAAWLVKPAAVDMLVAAATHIAWILASEDGAVDASIRAEA